MTFEEYLWTNTDKGIIDHSIRATCINGISQFYIHPSGKDGETLSFVVLNNQLMPVIMKDPNTLP